MKITPLLFSLLLLSLSVIVPCVAQDGVITTVAGGVRPLIAGTEPATTLDIGDPVGVAADDFGNLYVALSSDHTVIRVGSDGGATRVAGNGLPGFSGDGGPAIHASLNLPSGLALDTNGNLYIADSSNHRIRRVAPDGTIVTVAGTDQGDSGDGGSPTEARLNRPRGVAASSTGVLYIADTDNNRVRAISDEVIQAVAGTGDPAFSGDGGPASQAALWSPTSVAVDEENDIFIADSLNRRIRHVSADGVITSVLEDLSEPFGVSLGPSSTVLVTDSKNNRILCFAAGQASTIVAGDGSRGFSGDGGPATEARLFEPLAITTDNLGNIFVADSRNHRVRRISTEGVIATVAGSGQPAGEGGFASAASLSFVTGLAIHANELFLADEGNNRVARVSQDGTISTIAGIGEFATTGDGGAAAQAALEFPSDVAIDAAGAVFIADSTAHRVRRIAPNGIVTTVAGNSVQGFSGDGGPAMNASLSAPFGIAIDQSGNLFVADAFNNRIRKVSPNGLISTVAGDGVAGYAGDGGLAVSSRLNGPRGVDVDGAGNLFVADSDNHRIRRIGVNGRITSVAGNGQEGFSGDGSAAVNAALARPWDVVVDSAGALWISDSSNHRVRRVDPSQTIQTVAGGGEVTRDGVFATQARLNLPKGIALDPSGDLFIADSDNRRVRRVSFATAPTLSVAPPLLVAQHQEGSPPTPLTLAVSSGTPGLEIRARVADGAFSLSRQVARAPAVLEVSFPQNLAAGVHRGSIEISSDLSSPSVISASIELTVEPAPRPRLEVTPDELNLPSADATDDAALERSVHIRNAGGGALDYQASTNVPWLDLGASSAGTVTPTSPATLSVSIDADGLEPGDHQGAVRVFSPTTGETEQTLVSIEVPDRADPLEAPKLLLSRTGLTFRTITGLADDRYQEIGVLNIGTGRLAWSARAIESTGPTGWLRVTPDSGSTDAASLEVPRIRVQVDPSRVAKGEYSGQVVVEGPGGMTEAATVKLVVLPEGEFLPPFLTPTGVIFATLEGNPPGSQDVMVFNPGRRTPLPWLARPLTRGDWIQSGPESGSAGAFGKNGPGEGIFRLQPRLSEVSLEPDAYFGTVTFNFDEIRESRTLDVLLRIAPRSQGLTEEGLPAQGSCQATKLDLLFTNLGRDFVFETGRPEGIEVKVIDDCAQPLRAGSVIASFTNGDPGIALVSLKDGTWTGTWTPQTISSRATIEICATGNGVSQCEVEALSGRVNTGAIGPQPIFSSQGVVSAASFGQPGEVTPGGMVSVFGENLAPGVAVAESLPLPAQLAGVTATLGGTPLPLLFVSPGQINAIIPATAAVGAQEELQIGGSTASLTVVDSTPGVFTVNQTGTGQGYVVTSRGIADAINPAEPGDVVVIYCAGLGPVTPSVAVGAAAPTEPLSVAVNPVTVEIGGLEAEVFFAGLTPGFAGLYQINARVPVGVTAREAVPVVVRSGSKGSASVTMALR